MKIGLVLGSGGARGYAHIGVIDVLKDQGHEIAAISGSSMGALVGGIEAVGKLDEFTSWVTSLTQRDILRLLDPTLRGPGAVRLERVFARVEEMIGDTPIEDLPIPFTAVATDLFAQREIWFQSGPTAAAIRASIAIPSVITPVAINGRILADGGIANPLPVGPLIGADVDTIIAVDLAAGPPKAPARESSQRDEDAWQQALLNNPMVKAIFDLLPQLNPEAAADSIYDELPKELSTIDVAQLALDTMQAIITRFHNAAMPADLLINIPQSSILTVDYHKAIDQIELGRTVTREALNRAGI